jgi:HEAT repeat protein
MHKRSLGLIVILLAVLGLLVFCWRLLSFSRSPAREITILERGQSPKERADAASHLGNHRATTAVPALLKALRDDGAYDGPPSIVGTLILAGTGSGVVHEVRYVHQVAADALCKIGGPAVVDGLVPLVDDEDPRVRERAAAVLVTLKPDNQRAVPALLDILESNESETVRYELLGVLEKIGVDRNTGGDRAARVLKNTYLRIPASQPGPRMVAIRLYHAIFPDDLGPISALVEILSDPRAGPSAATMLQDFYGTDRLVAALVEAARQALTAERRQAVSARLSQLPAADVVASLHTALTDPSPGVRQVSARVLARFEGKAKAAGPALRHLLTDRDDSVRLQAAVALWRIDHEANDTFPIMVACLESSTVDVRADAEAVFRDMGGGDAWAVPFLAAALHDQEPKLRIGAARALEHVGKPAASAKVALLAALMDPNEDVRLAVAKALAKIADDK